MMTRNRIPLIIITLFTVALTLASCNRKTIYYHYCHTNIEGWDREDTLTFHTGEIGHEGVMNEKLGIRMNSSYPFKAITIIVEQTVMPHNITFRDTINCPFVDDTGRLKGKGINYYDYKFPLTSIKVDKGDSIRINIFHNMRRENLPGISDIGIHILKP